MGTTLPNFMIGLGSTLQLGDGRTYTVTATDEVKIPSGLVAVVDDTEEMSEPILIKIEWAIAIYL